MFGEFVHDWRTQQLFPRISEEDFADTYGQTVTLALLARVEG